jgi:lysylphosphatidylglycerol synthetase-like protein (DUF2156 family)
MIQPASSNPMGAFWLLLLLVLSVYAIASAKGVRWKLFNLLIIIAFMAAGLGVGFALGAWGGNMAIGGHAAASLTILLGVVGALGCALRNKRRSKLLDQSKSG